MLQVVLILVLSNHTAAKLHRTYAQGGSITYGTGQLTHNRPNVTFSEYTLAKKYTDHRSATSSKNTWITVGTVQLTFMKHMGLLPEHRLLDMACGALRGGVHFVRYLESGHYYGVDINEHLINAGYDKELVPLGLDKKLPRGNLHVSGDYQGDPAWAEHSFDFAISVSLWTHIPLSEIRRSLDAMRRWMRPGGLYYTSFWLCNLHDPFSQQAGSASYCQSQWRDLCCFQLTDLEELAHSLGLSVRYIGGALFPNPRNQTMLEVRF